MAKFQKGQSGNPAGRPKGQTPLLVTPALRRMLEELDERGVSRGEKIASVLLQRALTGDMDAIKTVLDRVDGKVVAPVDVTSDGEPLTFKAYVGFDPEKV